MAYQRFNIRLLAVASVCSLLLGSALLPEVASAQSAIVSGAPSGTGQNTVGDPKTGGAMRSPVGPDTGAEGVNGAPSGAGQNGVGDRKMGTAMRGPVGPDSGAENVNGAPSGTGQSTVGDPKTGG